MSKYEKKILVILGDGNGNNMDILEILTDKVIRNGRVKNHKKEADQQLSFFFKRNTFDTFDTTT